MESRRANSESNIPERFGSWKNLNNKLYLHSRIKPKETENGKLWFDPFFDSLRSLRSFVVNLLFPG